MEQILMLSQTLFYFVTSFAIIVLGAILCVIAYYVVQIGRRIHKISENVEKSSAEVRENIAELFDKLSEIPFISSFFKKGRTKKEK
ncbi:MAG: hypothetical protein A3B25_01525 [Candidatus Ryanbacteria bacterium RIFCSPLOWO2_01_FULL_48_26]|uniref:Uncharacterized protein n=1 Tax=Candidatus Ryanbacteria bacterium RIFCSPLOWO2_01_FULL_48_26 TaxID=1802126 RepID=A0A1G2GX49_9BACT|nr:MAG: hypothetical protein A3B25_01525 [Candidatus Ryanbacteria bacterium RIFCSPLOWO2_01_FULL_48_26]